MRSEFRKFSWIEIGTHRPRWAKVYSQPWYNSSFSYLSLTIFLNLYFIETVGLTREFVAQVYLNLQPVIFR